MYQAEIKIMLKKTVADPQGLTIKHALESLGFKNITEARIGKSISVCLNANNKEQAQAQVEEMCKKLLANPIIEDFTFEVLEI